MERGAIVGGMLVGISFLLAVVFNSHATRDAALMGPTDEVGAVSTLRAAGGVIAIVGGVASSVKTADFSTSP